MSKLEERLRLADKIAVQDEWEEIRNRPPRPSPPAPITGSRRWLTVALALAVGVLAFASVKIAFEPGRRPPGSASNEPTPAAIDLRESARVDVGATAYSVATADGAVWVVTYDFNNGSGGVVRIDTATDQVVATIPIEGFAYNIAAAGGYVWVETGDPKSGFALARIEEVTNKITGTVPGVTGPVGVDATGVWAVQGRNVVLIDPISLSVRSTTALSEKPLDLTTAGGSVWVLERAVGPDNSVAPGPLVEIDAATAAVVRTVNLQIADVRIAGDTEGVWVSGWRPDDPHVSAAFFVPASGGPPKEVATIAETGIVAVAQGRVWFIGSSGLCGLNVSTHVFDACAPLRSSVDPEGAHDPVAYDPVFHSLWIAEYESRFVDGFQISPR
jgi:hypothetical protein